jgi:hypothetical protein
VIPTWWQFLLLALAAARLTRFVGWDDLTIQLRRRVTRLGDEEHKQWAYVIDHQREVDYDPWELRRVTMLPMETLRDRLKEATGRPEVPPLVLADQPWPPVSEQRYYLSKMLRCPWCLGFWVSIAWWLAWLATHHWTLLLAVPFAISEAVGLASKNLDP